MLMKGTPSHPWQTNFHGQESIDLDGGEVVDRVQGHCQFVDAFIELVESRHWKNQRDKIR